jgi:hypothetical protein
MELNLNLYPRIESDLQEAIGNLDGLRIEDVWEVFCQQYAQLKLQKPSTMGDLGIQSELFIDRVNSTKVFYFAYHYSVNATVDDEEYNFYELVYCEFDLSDTKLDLNLNDDSIEIWESTSSYRDDLLPVENWSTFKALKHLRLRCKVFGDEM